MDRKRSIRASKGRGAMLGTKYEAQQKVDVEPKLTGVSCGKWLQPLSSSFGQVIQLGISVSVKFVSFA